MRGKTVFLCRNGAPARFIADHLSSSGRLDGIVVETGRAARRRKVRREMRRRGVWGLPALAVDLTALAIYGRLWKRALTSEMKAYPTARDWPTDIPRETFDDANEPACVEALQRMDPEVLVVFGTSILRSDVLSVPSRAALNIHGGIVPGYRNVHSEVWAVLRDDVENIGTSILHLDEGVDSGAVALERRVVSGGGGFFDLRWKNLELAANLIGEALELDAKDALPREPQNAARPSGFFPTPGARELLRIWRFNRARGS